MSGNQPRPPSETTRIRDVPAPRLAEGVAAKPMRWAFTWPYRVILLGVYRAGFRPWHLTLLGLVTNVWVGASLLRGQFLLAGLLLIPAGLFDILDGAVARLRGEDSRSGAFLDSVLDRVADVILFGCLFWSLAGQGLRSRRPRAAHAGDRALREPRPRRGGGGRRRAHRWLLQRPNATSR